MLESDKRHLLLEAIFTTCNNLACLANSAATKF